MGAEHCVRVAVQIRPLSVRENVAGSRRCLRPQGATCVTVSAPPRPDETFSFDACNWLPDNPDQKDASQDYATNELGTLSAEVALAGLGGCVIACGTTGGGKSHMMWGSNDTPGLVSSVLDSVFVHKAKQSRGEELRVWLSLLEISGSEQIQDLLLPPFSISDTASISRGPPSVSDNDSSAGGELATLMVSPAGNSLSDVVVDLCQGAAGACGGLLGPGPKAQSGTTGERNPELRILDHPLVGVCVPGLTSALCSDVVDARRLLAFGAQRRSLSAALTGEGAAAASASRSHLVLMLRLQRLLGSKPAEGLKRRDERKVVNSRMIFAELAGSEHSLWSSRSGDGMAPTATVNGSSSRRRTSRVGSGGALNQSLAALGLFVRNLSDRPTLRNSYTSSPASGKTSGGTASTNARGEASRFPQQGVAKAREALLVRASKLTLLLREPLRGGGAAAGSTSRALLIAAVSPSSCSLDETLDTLRFAAAVGRIPVGEMTKARAAEKRHDDVVAALRAEQRRLMTEALSAGSNGPNSAANLREHASELARLSAELSNRDVAQYLQETRRLLDVQDAALDALGIVSAERALRSRSDQSLFVPYLVNCSRDPSLAGRLRWCLTSRHQTPGNASSISVGANVACDVVVSGPGIPDSLCYFELDGAAGGVIYLDSDNVGSRVCVNGSPLAADERREVAHGDKLVLAGASSGSRAAVFIVILEPQDANEVDLSYDCFGYDVVGSEAIEGEAVELSGAELMLLRDSEAWRELGLYLEDLWRRLGDTPRGRGLFAVLAQAARCVDEANDITDTLRSEDRLRFEVELVWDIHRDPQDVVVIRLLRREESATRDDSEANFDAGVVLGYWGLVKFRARLDRMRDCYMRSKHGEDWSKVIGDPVLDPWAEPPICDLRLRIAACVDMEAQRRMFRQGTERTKPVAPRTSGETPARGARGPQHGRASLSAQATSPERQVDRVAAPSAPAAGAGESIAEHERSVSRRSRSVRRQRSRSADSTEAGRRGRLFESPQTPHRRPRPSVVDEGNEEEEAEHARSNAAPEAENHPPKDGMDGSQQAKNHPPEDGMDRSQQDLLIAALRRQLQDKLDKEELYTFRIESLEQQISIYESHAAALGKNAGTHVRSIAEDVGTGRSSMSSEIVASSAPASMDSPASRTGGSATSVHAIDDTSASNSQTASFTGKNLTAQTALISPPRPRRTSFGTTRAAEARDQATLRPSSPTPHEGYGQDHSRPLATERIFIRPPSPTRSQSVKESLASRITHLNRSSISGPSLLSSVPPSVATGSSMPMQLTRQSSFKEVRSKSPTQQGGPSGSDAAHVNTLRHVVAPSFSRPQPFSAAGQTSVQIMRGLSMAEVKTPSTPIVPLGPGVANYSGSLVLPPPVYTVQKGGSVVAAPPPTLVQRSVSGISRR
eukprot:TRINITY_DN74547_c0_g1_i1.p1 TRINITY_DN74547_c0_g1~~TRINITY_DN74547_c0_g1_i1.p1  ORF type:complete len:1426 (-),score=241.24 TRINITY_DN74547_c0_g1_i1:394-4626(-)